MNRFTSFVLVIKYALDIIRQHELVKELQTKHQLSLYKALEKARKLAEHEHKEAVKNGPEYLGEDTNSLLRDDDL